MNTEFANDIWYTVFVYGIWGYSADNLYAVGYRAGGTNEDIYRAGGTNEDIFMVSTVLPSAPLPPELAEYC
jgi:hypothetical protein